jgi:hypothetical protein
VTCWNAAQQCAAIDGAERCCPAKIRPAWSDGKPDPRRGSAVKAPLTAKAGQLTPGELACRPGSGSYGVATSADRCRIGSDLRLWSLWFSSARAVSQHDVPGKCPAIFDDYRTTCPAIIRPWHVVVPACKHRIRIHSRDQCALCHGSVRTLLCRHGSGPTAGSPDLYSWHTFERPGHC